MLEEDTDSNIDVVDNFDIISFNQPNNDALLEITQKKDKKDVEEMEKYKKETDYQHMLARQQLELDIIAEVKLFPISYRWLAV